MSVHSLFFFFNDTATTEIYTLSLHDALPIWRGSPPAGAASRRLRPAGRRPARGGRRGGAPGRKRSEEHTSELQSRQYLVCRLLLEKKKKKLIRTTDYFLSTTVATDQVTHMWS